MSRNVHPLDQGQAVAPAPLPDFPPPPHPLSFVDPNNGRPGGGLPRTPSILRPIPVPATAPAPVPAPAPAPAPAPRNTPSKELRNGLAKVVAVHGIAIGALFAARYHESLNQANPPTLDELLLRVLDMRVKLGQGYAKFHQGSPNSVALRLLLARAGPRYPFEQNASDGIDRKGNPITGRKCACPGCEYRSPDHKRHTEDMHARDPVLALCCPYDGCQTTYYCGRDSEMRLHCDNHQTKGMPLSAFRLQ